MNSIRAKLAGVPAPIGGLALGIASLGWSWESMGAFNGNLQLLSALITAALLVLLFGKIIFAHRALFDDLRHPVAGSVVPTTAMAVMIVSKAFGELNSLTGEVLWLGSIALHIAFLCTFIYHRVKGFKLAQMVPSWFIPPVGVIVADVTVPSATYDGLAQALFWFGFGSYALMLPVMLYRLIFHPEVPDAAKPTIAILAAPASLSLAAYLSVSTDPSPILVAVLGGVAVIMTALIYLALLRLLRLPFSPGYSAFTFPLVVGATGLFKTVGWLESLHVDSSLIVPVRVLGVVELYIATAVVFYVCYKFLIFYSPILMASRAKLPNS